MAATETIQIPLGYQAADFKLLDTVDDQWKTLEDCRGEKATVVVFMCNHCPYVINMREKLVEVAREYKAKGVNFVAISSNDVANYPDDSPELMKELAHQLKFPFPYLYDETQEVAKAYDAACTPDFSAFDENLKCVYRGQFDDSRPKNEVEPTGKDLKKALDQLLAGEEVDKNQRPSLGCNIKWKK